MPRRSLKPLDAEDSALARKLVRDGKGYRQIARHRKRHRLRLVESLAHQPRAQPEVPKARTPHRDTLMTAPWPWSSGPIPAPKRAVGDAPSTEPFPPGNRNISALHRNSTSVAGTGLSSHFRGSSMRMFFASVRVRRCRCPDRGSGNTCRADAPSADVTEPGVEPFCEAELLVEAAEGGNHPDQNHFQSRHRRSDRMYVTGCLRASGQSTGRSGGQPARTRHAACREADQRARCPALLS